MVFLKVFFSTSMKVADGKGSWRRKYGHFTISFNGKIGSRHKILKIMYISELSVIGPGESDGRFD